METNRITKHIDRLLLDPNNYRFIDKQEYIFVPDEKIADEKIQLRTLSFLQGKNNENINDLVSSFKTNGFLDIDQIQVRALGEKYIVLEGNRRIAALKFLQDLSKMGFDIGKLSEQEFKSVPLVEIINDNPADHLITMGLHHITGKKRWSPVNQAQLIEDLVYKYDKSEDEVCAALGVSKHILRRNIRTRSLIQQFKESDYGDQFETNMYSLFEEVIKNPKIKEWIGWNDNDYKAINKKNIERFFSWISKTEETERNEDNVEQISILEPIITKHREIRELSEFIFDEKAILRMEESRSIFDGLTLSDAVGEAKLRNALSTIKTSVQIAFNYSEHLLDHDYEEINRLKEKLDRLIPSSQANITISDKRNSSFFQNVKTHFSNLEINRYRKIRNLKINNLNTINIFAGGNNIGKTSILEAVFLLTQLNNINGLLELEKLRGKFYKEFNSKWVNASFIDSIDLSGTFNNKIAQVYINKEETEENIEKTGYLSTLKIDSKVDSLDLMSSIHLFSNREPELRYLKSQSLCNSSFTSPYRNNINLLLRAHAFAIQEKYFDEIISFIIHNLDSTIQKIDVITENGEHRFMVTSSKYSEALDLTKYGEGLQRVFEIALLMCYSMNGILCIDEIDSAIHKNLLINFTKFIQQSAEKFNVQVFLSTHSKECIDAFIENGVANNEITAFALNEDSQGVSCKYVSGDRLEKLIDSINFDIR